MEKSFSSPQLHYFCSTLPHKDPETFTMITHTILQGLFFKEENCFLLGSLALLKPSYSSYSSTVSGSVGALISVIGP